MLETHLIAIKAGGAEVSIFRKIRELSYIDSQLSLSITLRKCFLQPINNHFAQNHVPENKAEGRC